MTILVTGGGGFLGGALTDALVAARVDFVASGRIGEHACDLGQSGALDRFLRDLRPKAIVNTAAVPDFGQSALARLYPVNTLAPAIMADYCSRTGAYLVQVSGTLVHGQRTELVGAQTPLVPDNDHGRSKLLAEHMIEASGARALRLRVGGIYGA
jgi:dTDP-4-dehydrorhamnose reductase